MNSPDSLPSSSAPSDNPSSILSSTLSPVSDQPWSRGVESVVVAVILLTACVWLMILAVNKPVVRSADGVVDTPSILALTEEMKVDINRADSADLQVIPGIGPALAGKIIAERNEGGPFKSADDLERVKGIGPRTIENIREYIVVSQNGDDKEVGQVDSRNYGE